MMPFDFCKILASVILMILFCCFDRAASGCSSASVLTKSQGSVTSPVDESGHYGSNLDLCWLIRTKRAVVIKFSKLDVETCCDSVRIYEGTETPEDSTERFRLSEADTTESEFWLNGTVLLRFVSDGSNQKTGFALKYRIHDMFAVPVTDFSPSVEVIESASGRRYSHPAYGNNYPNNMLMVWSIRAKHDQTVTVRFPSFVTEQCCDVLRVFQGSAPSIGSRELWNLTGNPDNIEHAFFGSVTLIFRTDGSVVKKGFNFEFSISSSCYRMSATFHHWSGTLSGGSSFTLFARPNNDGRITASCTLQLLRRKQLCANDSAVVKPTATSNYMGGTKFDFSHTDSDSCITAATCFAEWTSGPSGTMQLPLELPNVDPQSVNIKAVRPETWSASGLVQFRATSQAACPSTRHQCEVRTSGGSGGIPGRLISRNPTKFETELQCLGSVETHFAVAASTTDPVIACRLFNGSYTEIRVTVTSFSASNSWERPLLIVSGTLVLLLIAGCIVAWVLLTRAAAKSRYETAMQMRQKAEFSKNSYIREETTTDGPTEIYVS